ncbi:hypothetical protein WI73_00590 [Burkholderia ubonensis]|uniref:hypothetical protein n=1 Tax=Burkholderia ubonensis TaxID=101571 RepID=UPI000752D758|nr:hypothetical protein [Burkholderia ubonensis]KVC70967.1 hypothetical protein WI73_00590 [Burkholderia ubonensis]
MGLRLFKIGKVWYYRAQINGTRVQRTTGETAKHRAETLAECAYRHAHLWARGDEPVPTLRELVSQWLAIRTPAKSRSHTKIVEAFRRLRLYDLADVEIDQLTTDRVEAARLEHIKSHAPCSM